MNRRKENRFSVPQVQNRKQRREEDSIIQVFLFLWWLPSVKLLREVFKKKCRQFPNAQVMVAKPILSPALSPQDGWINSLWSTRNSLGTARGNVKEIHQQTHSSLQTLASQTHTDCVAGMGRQVQVLHKDHGTSENKLLCNCSPPAPAVRPVHFLNGNKSDAWSYGHLGRLLPLLCGLIALTLKRHLQVITVGSPSNHWNLSNSNHYAMY